MKGKSMLTKSLLSLLFLLPIAVCPPATGKTIYVDDDANGLNDGSSWENAYNFLQDALADANSTDKPVEIRVAQSICKPDQGSNQTQGDRKATFQLLKETIVKGGYAGFGHEDPNARDFELYKTILSGDLADNDVPVDDMHLLSENISILSNDPSRADNSFRIVTVISADSNILLEGAVITGSYDDYSLRKDDYISAGLYIQGTPNVTIRNCEFTRNAASGVLLKEEPTLTSEDCIFRKNTAISNGGGGICINYGGRARIVGCTFKDNWASSGGGVYFGAKIFTSDYLSSRQQEEIYLTDCTFIGNRAQYGGAIGCNYSTFYIEHTTFCENSAVCTGGAIRCRQSITNCCHCIFSGNSALDSGASIWTNGYKTRYMSAKQFIHAFNCTFRGNAAPIGRTLASMSLEKE